MRLRIRLKKVRHPAKPQNVTGVFNSDGSVSLTWDPVPGAKAYIIHYSNANQSAPSQATMMGYSEITSWNLLSENVPTWEVGDKLYFYLQTYNDLGVGADEIEKARYLHDGNFTGSSWSSPVVLTKSP